MAVTAKINYSSAGAQKVSVTVPSATAAQTFKKLNDVNVTSLEDGALVQYNASTDKFITTTNLLTTTGTLKISGGNF